MIIDYYRPTTIEEAISLLKKTGNFLIEGYSSELAKSSIKINVVDIQNLGLDEITGNNNSITIGSTTTLHEIIECDFTPETIKTAIKLDKPFNTRTTTRLYVDMVNWSGRSCLPAVLLSMDALIIYAENHDGITITDFFTNRPDNIKNKLITHIDIPIIKSSFNFVSAAPSSRPYICAALSCWTNGRTRLALGGYGKSPALVLDGSMEDNLPNAARMAYSEAGDEWASAAYRSEMAAVLTERCMKEIK